MKRLIVSGCSFTQYHWPTWPWFLAREFDMTYNYGRGGAGNEYIYNSIIEADHDLALNQDDIVIIAWSGYFRFDCAIDRDDRVEWQTHGDWSHHIDRKTIENYLNETYYIKKSLNYMVALSKYFTSKNIKYLFTSLYDLNDNLSPVILNDPYITGMIKYIHSENFIFKSGLFNLLLFQELDPARPKLFSDGHPVLAGHQKYAIEIGKHFDIDIPKQNLEVCDKVLLGKDRVPLNTKIYDKLRENGRLLHKHYPCLSPNKEMYLPDTIEMYKNILQELVVK